MNMTDGTSDIASQVQGEVVDSESKQAEPVKQPKVFQQEDVNKLIGQAKHDAYQKAVRDMEQKANLAALQTASLMPEVPAAQPPVQQAPVQAQPQSMGGMSQQPVQPGYMTEDAARQFMAQEWERQRQAAIGNQMAQDFYGKLSAGPLKHPDFDEKTANLRQMFKEGKLAHIAMLANGADNTADLIYHLGQNPHHIAELNVNFREDPRLALESLNRLSHSMKVNEEAQKQKVANEPLSRVQPTIAGTADNGGRTVKDFRRMLKV